MKTHSRLRYSSMFHHFTPDCRCQCSIQPKSYNPKLYNAMRVHLCIHVNEITTQRHTKALPALALPKLCALLANKPCNKYIARWACASSVYRVGINVCVKCGVECRIPISSTFRHKERRNATRRTNSESVGVSFGICVRTLDGYS